MKKFISFIVVFFVAIITIFNVSAKSNDIEISNVELLEKSDEVKANIEDYKDLNINLNTLFFSKDDYVKYKITIKNNTKNTMKIDDILDNFNSEVLETIYDIDKKELKSNEEYIFTLTIKCIKDIEEEKIVINNPLSIIIKYNDGKTIDIDVNPNTKDNIINFFIIFILSAISLIAVITKRGKKQLLGILLFVSLIPIGSNAAIINKKIIINNDIKVYGKTAVFKTGVEVNKQLKLLAGTDISTSDNSYSVVDINIIEIRRSNDLLEGFIPSLENTLSTEESRIPIYAWFDNGKIYYYTEAANPLLNENSSRLFQNLSKLTNVDLNTMDTNNLVDMSFIFNLCISLEELDLSNFDTINVNTMRASFQKCESLNNLDLSNFKTSNVENMSAMFNYCSGLININLSSFDTSNVVSFYRMFNYCGNIESLNLSNFKTNNATDIKYMFANCTNLKNVNISNFDTSKVEDMSSMFTSCKSLEHIDLSSFNTKNVVDMSYMFNNCVSLIDLDLSNFYTDSLVNMERMFSYCANLKSLDISNFNTTNVTNMATLFYGCSSLENLDILNFNTANVTTMHSMFYGCNKLKELDLSSFDTSNVVEMSYMFNRASSLEKIYASEKFVTDNVINSDYMFWVTTNLVGGNGTLYNSGYRDKTYARIDTEETPGYFTLKSA